MSGGGWAERLRCLVALMMSFSVSLWLLPGGMCAFWGVVFPAWSTVFYVALLNR